MFGGLSSLLLGASLAIAAPAARPANHAVVRIVPGPFDPDSPHGRWLGLEFRLTPGWHVYWRNPGDAGSPPTAAWALPANWHIDDLQWPRPRRIEVPPLTAFGYENLVVFPLKLRVLSADGARRGVIRGRVSWVACKLECVAEEDSVTLVFGWMDTASAVDRRLVERAVDELPLPPPTTWTLGGESSGANIVVTAHTPFADAIGADFFPAEPGVLDHSAKVDVTTERNRFTLRLTLSRYASAAPTRMSGLLVLRSRDGNTRSYDVDFPIRARVIAQAGAASPFVLLFLAFISGLLVNIMPCVFPLLGIKALSLASTISRRRERVARAVSYGAGSVLSSAAVGGVLLMASGPARSAWGFQMQSPRFLGIVALVTFAAALSLFGVFDVPSLWPAWLSTRADKLTANAGSFVTGAGAILIGAPCTAPFFGATLAGALAAPRAVGFAAFATFGIGAAAPFAALALAPAVVARMPRPGRWMETLKQFLAFPLLGATAWLVWVAQLQTGAAGSASLLGALCASAFAVWILGRWRTASASTTTRRIALIACTMGFAAALTLVGSLRVAPRLDAGESGAEIRWHAFTDARLDSLRSAGRPVLVDFTAAWCLTCKVNEIGALRSTRVAATLRANAVGLLRADLTVADSALIRALHAAGGASVPTYALYSPGGRGNARLLPTLLTPGAVVDAVEQAMSTGAPTDGASASRPSLTP